MVDYLSDYLGFHDLKKLATLFNMPKLARQFNDLYVNGKRINFRNLNTQLIQNGMVTAFDVNVLEDGLTKIGQKSIAESVTKYKQKIPDGLRQNLKSYKNPYAEFKIKVNDHLGHNEFLWKARMRLQVPDGIETEDFLDFAEYLEEKYGMDIHDQSKLTWILEEIGMKSSKSFVEELAMSMLQKK